MPGHGEAWLSVGDFQSEADADAKAKDREETKRLLYVALTRARDRLYLASEVKDARWRAFGGSLGDILPPGVKARFEAASMSPAPETTEWAAASGNVHTFRVCATQEPSERRRDSLDENLLCASAPLRRNRTSPDNFAPLIDPFELPRVAVTQGARAGNGEAAPQSDRHRAAAASPARSCTACSSASARRLPATPMRSRSPTSSRG